MFLQPGLRDLFLVYVRYRHELESFVAGGSLSKLIVAVSREENCLPKAYVQDEIRRSVADIGRLIVEESAVVYVCG